MSASVAVVLRTRARPLLLRRALAGIASQTHADWQLVVVVDGGDPAEVTEALAAAGLAEDPRVTVLADAPGRGRAGAANAGLAATDAELVVLHDDDDSWAPRFLEATVAHLAAHPDQVAVATRTDAVTEHVGERGIKETGREPLAPELDRISLVSVARRHEVPSVSLVVRRDVQRQVGQLDESLPVLEDWDFLLRLLAHGPVGYLPGEPLAAWHRRPEATGDDANSVVAEPELHREVAERIRERHLRGDLSTDGGVVRGLGLPLVVTRELDEHREWLMAAVAAQGEEAAQRAEHHREHLDLLANAQREHVDVTTTELQLEVGRLRGELMVLRELVAELTEELETTHEEVESALKRTTGTIDATLAAVRAAAAEEPTRPAREVLDRVTARASAAWRSGRGRRPATPSAPVDEG